MKIFLTISICMLSIVYNGTKENNLPKKPIKIFKTQYTANLYG